MSYVHGTATAYRKYRCRCTRCRDAHYRGHRAWVATIDPANIPHGTATGYNTYGCRLECCRVAHADRRRELRHAKTAAA